MNKEYIFSNKKPNLIDKYYSFITNFFLGIFGITDIVIILPFQNNKRNNSMNKDKFE